jgi:hypothetical protein
VFEVVNGARQKIRPSFPGTYTDGGCFEDNPETLVKNALQDAGRLTPEIDRLFKERERKSEFEKLPLYTESAGVLTITERGKRDLRSIVVDGKVVWTGAKKL